MTAPPDPKRIVDDVLAALPASSLDASEQQMVAACAAQDALLGIARGLSSELAGGRRLSGPAVRRDLRARSLSARWKRLLDAQDRLEGYMAPRLDLIEEAHEGVVADG